MVFQEQDRFALPPTHQGPPEFVHLKLRVQTYKLFSQSRIHRASAPAAETQAASVPHPDLRPSTSQPRAPRPEDPSYLCLLSPVPFSFNVGRAVGKDPPTLESEISKPERLLDTWPSLLPQLFSSLSASGLMLPRVRVTYGASGEEQGPTQTLRPNNVCHPA